MQDALKRTARFFYISRNCVDRAQNMALWVRLVVEAGWPEHCIHTTDHCCECLYNPCIRCQKQVNLLAA